MFWVNNEKMPTPDKDGVSVTKNKIWASNAGRVASGKFVGDIIATKLSIEIKYTRLLTAEEVKKIDKAVHKSAFMTVKVKTDDYVTATCYVDDVSYTLHHVQDGVVWYEGLTVSLVEQ